MPGKNTMRVAIRVNAEEGEERIQAVEFNDKGLGKAKEFSAKAPFTAEVYAKFAAFVGERRAYGDAPYTVHLVNQGMREKGVKALPKLIYGYDLFKELHPDESKGQCPVSQIVTKYPTGKFQGAKQLAKAIIDMRATMRKKGINPDEIEDREVLRRQANADKSKARESTKKAVEQKHATQAIRIKSLLSVNAKQDEKTPLAVNNKQVALPAVYNIPDVKHSASRSRVNHHALSVKPVDDKAAARALMLLSKFVNKKQKSIQAAEVAWNDRVGLYAMKY